jgi:ParB family chromosome partitioning protein
MTTTIQEIPLAKLIPSVANVRKTNRNEGIGELAASIKAHGLLQNLTVRKGTGANKSLFEVIAGGRRLAALRKLAQRKQIEKNSRIRCHVLNGESAEEISLAENVMQCPMHPADQYEAFAKLHNEQGMSAEDIAARFGVTAAVVKQRLKLGAISPKLMKLYRDDELNLDQLTAFAFTDDHAAQERVWLELGWNKDRRAILQALTGEQVPTDDRRVRFVGLATYEQAGGAVTRDLFDGDGAGYCADPALLKQLVRDKLQRAAKKVMAEGWKWVAVDPDFDHEGAAGMRRVYPQLSAEDETKCKDLESERDALYETATEEGAEEVSEEEFSAKVEALEQQITAYAAKEQYRPEDVTLAGAFVCLGPDGKPRIERGHVRAEDVPHEDATENERGEDASAAAKPLISEKLVAELTAHRTSALRNELGQNPAMALVTLTHALAAALFFHAPDVSCLRVAVRGTHLASHASGIGDSLAETEINERHEAWAKRMPRETGGLWEFVAGLADGERLALLAHCVSLGTDAVQSKGADRGALAHADVLARAVGLDMTRYWQPTAASYFGRVSKERIMEAVRETDGDAAARHISGFKKQAMAEAAEKALTGKAWLPEPLRTP